MTKESGAQYLEDVEAKKEKGFLGKVVDSAINYIAKNPIKSRIIAGAVAVAVGVLTSGVGGIVAGIALATVSEAAIEYSKDKVKKAAEKEKLLRIENLEKPLNEGRSKNNVVVETHSHHAKDEEARHPENKHAGGLYHNHHVQDVLAHKAIHSHDGINSDV